MTHPAATPPTAEQVEAIIRHYADNYRLMGRMGDGKIHGSSVAVDLEMNILKQVLAALAPAERAEAVPDWEVRAARSIADMAAEWYRGPSRGDQDLPADLIMSRLRRFIPTRAGALDAAGAAVTEAQYLAAITGRSDFRNAYRRALVVVKYARVLRDKWRTRGQQIDNSDFLGAISDTCDAADQFDFGSGKIEDVALAAGDGAGE